MKKTTIILLPILFLSSSITFAESCKGLSSGGGVYNGSTTCLADPTNMSVVNGALTLNGTIVNNNAQVNGSLNATNSTINQMMVTGQANFRNSNAQMLMVTGALSATDSKFGTLNVNSISMTLNHCYVDNLSLSHSNLAYMEQGPRINLTNNSIVNNITFSGSSGRVFVDSTSQVGKVNNGVVVNQ